MDSLIIDVEHGKRVAKILFDRFHSSNGIFGHNEMPEDLMWGSDLSDIGAKRGSYEHIMFITMVVSIDYQRSADKLWEAGRNTMNDKEVRWLFSPDAVSDKPINEIMQAMKKHKLSQKHRKDAGIWEKVSQSFQTLYDSDPRNLIKECEYDAMRIYSKKYDTRFKKNFPFLSGNKIFPLWIRMLHDNLDIDLKNLEKISIPIDVHVARATFATGCLKGDYNGTIAEVTPKINEAWKKAVESLEHPRLKYVLQLDEALWNLSKNGCTFRKGRFCPQKEQCPVGRFCVESDIHVSAKEVRIVSK